ncbi:MAG: SdrD B-like domain-containing protein [Thermomicrobiales bacterium]
MIQPTGSDLILFTPTRPRGTPTRSGVADCFWGTSVFVWQDDYGDGKQGGDEPSLADVPVVMTRPGVGPLDAPKMTNDSGKVSFYLSTSCPMEEYSVEVLVPTGYRATTPTRITGIGGLTLRVGLVRE